MTPLDDAIPAPYEMLKVGFSLAFIVCVALALWKSHKEQT